MRKLLFIFLFVGTASYAQQSSSVWSEAGVSLNYHPSGEDRLSITVSNTHYKLHGADFIDETVMHGKPENTVDYNGRVLSDIEIDVPNNVGRNIFTDRQFYFSPNTSQNPSNLIMRENGTNYAYGLVISSEDNLVLSRRPGGSFTGNFVQKREIPTSPDWAPKRTSLGETMTYKTPYVGMRIDSHNCDRVSELVVTDSGDIGDINLHIELEHGFLEDLQILLESPTGVLVMVMDRAGGHYDNLDVVFDQDAVNHLTIRGNNPSGTYRPVGRTVGYGLSCVSSRNTHNTRYISLDDFNGHRMNGIWKLHVLDVSIGNRGTLNYWGLEIEKQ